MLATVFHSKYKILLIAALVCMGIIYYSTKYIVPAQKSVIPPQQQEYIKNFSITIYNTQGELENTIAADNWEYISGINHSLMTNPCFTIVKADQAKWHINSAQAKIFSQKLNMHKITKIQLRNKVVITREQELNSFKLTTSELDYFPDTQNIRTLALVKINQPNLEITGTGMQAYLNTNLMELHSNVKTNYLLDNTNNSFY